MTAPDGHSRHQQIFAAVDATLGLAGQGVGTPLAYAVTAAVLTSLSTKTRRIPSPGTDLATLGLPARIENNLRRHGALSVELLRAHPVLPRDAEQPADPYRRKPLVELRNLGPNGVVAVLDALAETGEPHWQDAVARAHLGAPPRLVPARPSQAEAPQAGQ